MWSVAQIVGSFLSAATPEIIESSGHAVVAVHPWIPKVLPSCEEQERVRVVWEQSVTLEFLRGRVGIRNLWVSVRFPCGMQDYRAIAPAFHASSVVAHAATLVADGGDIQAIIEVVDADGISECSVWVSGHSADLGTLCQRMEGDCGLLDLVLRILADAQLAGRSIVYTSDLLLGVLRTPGIAKDNLESYGVTAEKVEATAARNESSFGSTAAVFSMQADEVLDRADRHARAAGTSPTPSDVVYGIMTLEDCEAKRILRQISDSPRELERHVLSRNIW